MGWTTDLITTLSFNRKTYTSLSQVEEDIEECKEMISYYKNKVLAFALTTEPKKICPKTYENEPLTYIQNELELMWEELDEYYWNLTKLEILKDSWKYCHDESGLAIPPPEKWKWNTAYLDGDFVPTTKEPNKHD